MNLAEILQADTIVSDLAASDRWQVIDELIDCLVAAGKIKLEHRDAVVAVVRKRETSMSTGIGFGIGEDWRDGVSEASCDETVQHDGDGTGR